MKTPLPAKFVHIGTAVEQSFEEAIQFAKFGNVLGEEEAIQRAFSLTDGTDWRGRVSGWTQELFESHVTRGMLRKNLAYLGGITGAHFFPDRIVFPGRSVRLMDEHVEAVTDTAGSIRESSRPTLTRMAMGSILPGSALIPGLAFQKKSVTDDRTVFFVVNGLDWAWSAQVEGQYMQAVLQLAASINAAAKAIGARKTAAALEVAPAAPAAPSQGLVDQIEKLAALRQSGAINDDEFTAFKLRLLNGGGLGPVET